jgi:hypothetical protein
MGSNTDISFVISHTLVTGIKSDLRRYLSFSFTRLNQSVITDCTAEAVLWERLHHVHYTLLLLVISVIWWNIGPVCSFGMHKPQQTHSHRRALILLIHLWLLVDLLTDSGKILEQVCSKNVKIKIYRTIILPVVLYGCETWSLTLRV